MKKIVEFIKKHDILAMMVIIAIAIFADSFYTYIFETDKLWNFGNIYKLSIGRTIYQETNIIITPLFFIIGKWLFNIFGANFLTFNIYGYILNVIMYLMIYIILRKVKISKRISIITEFIIIIMTRASLVGNGANYNILAFIILEIGLLICLRNNKRYDYLLHGTLATISFLVYQKMGAGYILAIILFELLNNKNKQTSLINIIKILGIALVEITMFILYELSQNNLYNFLNMCILSLKDFGTSNANWDIEVIKYGILVILTIVFTCLLIKTKRKELKEEEYSKIKALITFSIGCSIICIPIFNIYHAMIAIILWEILLVYCIEKSLKEIFDDKRIKKIFNIIITLLIVYFVLEFGYEIFIHENLKKYKNYNENLEDMYYGAYIDEYTEEKIKIVNEYIEQNKKKENNVVIFSIDAMLFSENYDSNNGLLDLPLKGNFGKNGENEIIRRINNLSKTIILMENKEKTKNEIYQFADRVRKYVNENMKKISELENYDVYITNDLE